jgi:hypothetical protein
MAIELLETQKIKASKMDQSLATLSSNEHPTNSNLIGGDALATAAVDQSSNAFGSLAKLARVAKSKSQIKHRKNA